VVYRVWPPLATSAEGIGRDSDNSEEYPHVRLMLWAQRMQLWQRQQQQLQQQQQLLQQQQQQQQQEEWVLVQVSE